MGGLGDGGLGGGSLGGGSGFSLTVQLVVAPAWSLVHSSALMAPHASCMHRYCWLHPVRACSPFADTSTSGAAWAVQYQPASQEQA